MAKKLKIRAKAKDGVVIVKVLMTHPMETGMRKDKKTKELIPAHFINEVTVEAAGKTVLTSYWNGSVSKNPYLSMKYKGASGDAIKVAWKDNKGESASGEAKAK